MVVISPRRQGPNTEGCQWPWWKVSGSASAKLMTDLSASVQRELPEIIEHAVTVDCRGTGDMGGVTRAIAVSLMGEAVSER